jgi:hypothetical protein
VIIRKLVRIDRGLLELANNQTEKYQALLISIETLFFEFLQRM